MYGTSDFKKGLKILMDNQPFMVLDFQHVKPGKGNQFTRTKIKNLISGAVLDKTFKSGEKINIPDTESRSANFLYQDEDHLYFMYPDTYDQISLEKKSMGDATYYLTENMNVKILFFNNEAISLDLPKSVPLKVVSTEPGLKGNTVSGATKPATLETNLKIQVPLHINSGDLVKIDTESGKYIERIQNK